MSKETQYVHVYIVYYQNQALLGFTLCDCQGLCTLTYFQTPKMLQHFWLATGFDQSIQPNRTQIRVYMGLHGFAWVYMGLHGFAWVCMGLHAPKLGVYVKSSRGALASQQQPQESPHQAHPRHGHRGMGQQTRSKLLKWFPELE